MSDASVDLEMGVVKSISNHTMDYGLHYRYGTPIEVSGEEILVWIQQVSTSSFIQVSS